MNFDEILKSSLAAVNDGYAAAHTDLSETVNKVREAVTEHTDDKVALELQKVASDLKSTTFRLYLDPNVNDLDQGVITITFFQLPASGYPVKFGTFIKSGSIFNSIGEAEDKEALLSYFADLLDSPESMLVQAVGYALRQRRD